MRIHYQYEHIQKKEKIGLQNSHSFPQRSRASFLSFESSFPRMEKNSLIPTMRNKASAHGESEVVELDADGGGHLDTKFLGALMEGSRK